MQNVSICELPQKRQLFVAFSWKTGSVEVRFLVEITSAWNSSRLFTQVLIGSHLFRIFSQLSSCFCQKKIIVVRWSYKDPTECCPHAAAVFHQHQLLRRATSLWATLGFSLERNWSSNRVKSENQLFKAMKCFCYANNWKTCMTQERSL